MESRRRKKMIMLGMVVVLLVLVIIVGSSVAASMRKKGKDDEFPSSFTHNYDITWAPDHVKLSNEGRLLDLTLDQTSGAGFGSKNRYLYGHFEMQIRLVQNDSAGTITAFYMSSLTDDRDEFNFEFAGNKSGQPYSLLTNIFVNGVGGREEKFRLWFDPAAYFHSYSLHWSQHQVMFMVDDVPIRLLKNKSEKGIPYPYNKPMGIYASIWNGDGDEIDWRHAPFSASFASFGIEACQYKGSPQDCPGDGDGDGDGKVNENEMGNLTWVRNNYMIYDYCSHTSSPECNA